MTQMMQLQVRTRAIELPANFKVDQHLPANATAFLREGEGLIGKGTAVKLAASGANRFAELAEQFSALAESAVIDNQDGGLARGLVAFGSVAFSAKSEMESVLAIPQTLLGVRDGRAWITQVWTGEAPAEVKSVSEFEQAHETYASSQVKLEEGSITAENFEATTRAALELIEKGKLQKVVLARDLKGSVTADFDLRRGLQRLAERYPNCWVYSVDGTFGASPELLVRVTHSQVSARVLAGTASRGTDPQVDRAIANALVESTKNNREHEFAVKSLVQSLEQLCEQVIADEKPFSLALPNVWHLASDVTAVLKEEQSSLTLAAALHPTAAVAGTPTKEALAEIEKLEGIDRGRYAGPVGWLSADGDGEWAIALRGGQLSDSGITAFAGCGLVAESDPRAELAETELKFQPIRYALN